MFAQHLGEQHNFVCLVKDLLSEASWDFMYAG